MFDNGKVSSSQLKKLLIFDIISISIIILPGIAAKGAGKDGLIAIITGSVLALIYSLFFFYVSNKLNNEYLDFSLNNTGILSFIIGGLYVVKILFSCWFSLRLFIEVINETLLPDTNPMLIVFFLILVSIYTASKGIEVRARVVEIFFYIVIVPLILLFIFGIKRIEIWNLFPLLTTPVNEILNTSYNVLLTYSAVEILVFTCTAITPHENKFAFRIRIVQAIIISAAVNIALFILAVGLLGLPGAENQIKASIIVMQQVKFPGSFVQRQDAIMLTIWMFSLFTILTAYFYYLANITGTLVKVKKHNSYLILYGVLLFLLCLIQLPLDDLFSYYGIYMAYIGFPQSIVIPLIVILISKIKNRKGGARN